MLAVATTEVAVVAGGAIAGATGAGNGAEIESEESATADKLLTEILLTPGVFLRVDHHSSVRMVSPGLADTIVTLEKGRATGVYEDFLTGFTTNGKAWGRPVGVAVAADGSLLVTDDGAKVIWRVTYTRP